MFDAGWDAGLDEAQLAAATHGDGPLIVVAGAGTGKTRTLIARVARWSTVAWTRNGCCCSRSPAGPRRRWWPGRRAVCDRRDAARLWGGTFHAVAYRLVAAHAETLGLSTALSVLDPATPAI